MAYDTISKADFSVFYITIVDFNTKALLPAPSAVLKRTSKRL